MIKRNNSVDALYIHVPFCSHICSYCDFPKMFYYPKFADDYIKTVTSELKDNQLYKTIYIGGGTPSSLDDHQFDTLLGIARNHLLEKGHFCVELNPENCTNHKIDLLVKHGVNRVSIGVQTFQQTFLKQLGRQHTNEVVFSLVKKLNQVGIVNISCDLIYGLPSQTLSDLRTDLSIIVTLPIKHISTYPLSIENHTYFSAQSQKPADEELQLKMYNYIIKYLKKYGFNRYEISNFAQRGYESYHNLIYWHNRCYKGVGPGASGYENGIRYTISKNYIDYFHGIIRKEESIVSDSDYKIEYIMLHLRTIKGIDLEDYKQVFGSDFVEEFNEPVQLLQKRRLISFNKNFLFITTKGFFIENTIIGEIIKKL